jgi:phage-related protein
MKNRGTLTNCLIIGCGAVLTLAVPASARWQQVPGQDGQQQAAQTQEQGNNDVTRPEVSSFDRFLDAHPGIEKELDANPSLVNDSNYLQSHPDLQTYLSQHPNVKAELLENPNDFMRRENRFEGSRADRDPTPGRNANPDLTGWDIGRTDQFLDEHHEIEEQLEQNPALINDSNYLAQHPALQEFLNQHPQIREEFDENPRYFMQRENQFENSPADRDRQYDRELGRMSQFLNEHPSILRDLESNPTLVDNKNYLDHHTDLSKFLNEHPRIKEEFDHNPRYFMQRENQLESAAMNRDLTRQEVSEMDQFLDQHKDIEKQLEKNPFAINDQRYLEHHKDLARFLDDHPRIREEFDENPRYFMQRENQFEASAADRDQARPYRNQANPIPANPNPDLTTQEVARMDQFLDDHEGIEKQLEKNPSLIDNKKYLDHHKDLARFLDDHPQIREEVDENPRYFMQRENQFEGSPADRDYAGNRRGLDDKDLADFNKFLDKHKNIAKDLDKYPARANDQGYLDHHKDLRKFFDEHGQCRTEFAENPQYFMQRERQFEQLNDHRFDNRNQDQRLDQRADTDHRSQL